ncbi:MAG: ribbon-helix-helix domain-containing protein [Alphaproteobacteria bacterium]|nr:ribbon-helix-helix domain-containing protein [Alphaproteobacteria bacterium]
MTSGLVKHSVTIAGHRTSISLEPEFWSALREIAKRNNRSLGSEIAVIDAERSTRNLSSAIRVHVLKDALAHIKD